MYSHVAQSKHTPIVQADKNSNIVKITIVFLEFMWYIYY